MQGEVGPIKAPTVACLCVKIIKLGVGKGSLMQAAIYIYIYIYIYNLFIYLFLAASGLTCGSSIFAVARSVGCPMVRGMLVSQPGIEPTSSALKGRFLTPGPLGSSHACSVLALTWQHENGPWAWNSSSLGASQPMLGLSPCVRVYFPVSGSTTALLSLKCMRVMELRQCYCYTVLLREGVGSLYWA